MSPRVVAFVDGRGNFSTITCIAIIVLIRLPQTQSSWFHGRIEFVVVSFYYMLLFLILANMDSIYIDVLNYVSNPCIVYNPSRGVKHPKQLTWQVVVRACSKTWSVTVMWIFLG